MKRAKWGTRIILPACVKRCRNGKNNAAGGSEPAITAYSASLCARICVCVCVCVRDGVKPGPVHAHAFPCAKLSVPRRERGWKRRRNAARGEGEEAETTESVESAREREEVCRQSGGGDRF